MKKLTGADKRIMTAYCTWHYQRYDMLPGEYDLSKLIDNMNSDSRSLVESFLDQMKAKYNEN